MKVKAKGDTRIRFQPFTNNDAYVAGVLPGGSVIDAQPIESAPGWYRFDLTAGGLGLRSSVLNKWSPYCYALQELFTLVVDPPIERPRTVRVGVSVLNAHHLLEPAYRAGIRSFLIMNGIGTARAFKAAHPDATVMYRKFMNHGRYLPDVNGGEMRELQTIGGGIILMTPCNEQDIWPNSSPDEIKARAAFDTAMAIECAKYGTLYAAGGFAVGNPDYTNPAICQAMADGYAPGYNSGLFGMNVHSYSPNANNIFATDGRQVWHETRWRFMFEKCGFRNNANAVGIVADECGLDEGGVGGVPAHGLDAGYVERWTRKFIELSSQPVHGQPSPCRAATWFQAGNQTDWAGYNIEWAFDAIARGNA